MFPLGTVILPSELLPLHVFEDRYRQLVRTCLQRDRRFGTVLIERGSEVGGGDQRAGIGTWIEMAAVQELPDGRFAVAGVATGRLRVSEWLVDDPYPRALVHDHPDEPARPGCHAAILSAREGLAELARRTGEGSATDLDLAADPIAASYQLAAAAPLGPYDRFRLLADAGPDDRAEHLAELLQEHLDLLE